MNLHKGATIYRGVLNGIKPKFEKLHITNVIDDGYISAETKDGRDQYRLTLSNLGYFFTFVVFIDYTIIILGGE